MGWRTVVISNCAKLECNLGNMVVRNKTGFKKIPLNELSIVIVESTAVSMTAALLSELNKEKVKVIICDEKRNPSAELVSYYGSHDTSQKIKNQLSWDETIKKVVWTKIVTEKIQNQSDVLLKNNRKEALILKEYISQIELNDVSNREGHAAKVYFNSLFGKDFSRDDENTINAALNYGYSIILSVFNREIVSGGYITQLGLFHCNMYNQFNLSCDLMEPFRPLIDDKVLTMDLSAFEQQQKLQLIDILNDKVYIDGQKHTVLNAIKIYAKSVLDSLDKSDISILRFWRNEL